MGLTIQVLVSTMHQTDYTLLEKMNIQTDAIVINQCDRNETKEFRFRENNIKWISLSSRGVGISRNTAIMNATADILLFADDDVVYDDDFKEKVIKEFESNPKYGLITFNLQSLNPDRPESIDLKKHRIHWYNSLKYGAFRIAVNREEINKQNIFFSLLFGGGARFQAGEDNLFLNKVLQSGIKALASNVMIGTVAQKESTWFKGYNQQYFFDRGFLFANMFGKKAKIILMMFELRSNNNCSEFSLIQRLKTEKKGIKAFFKDRIY